MRCFVWVILLLTYPFSGAHCAPSSKLLLQLYENKHTTFFCDLPFSAQGDIEAIHHKHHIIQSDSIQWMSIVPLKQLAKHYACYQQKCLDKKGKIYQGIRCCQKQDSQFQRMMQDLHNIVPETRELKRLRQRYTFAEFNHEMKDGCHLYIDKKHKIIEPAPSKRGLIARTYLYMKDTYPFVLTEQEIELYLKWHQQYPVSEAERERNEKIFQLQGMRNHYVG
ncbi:endonuclease [Candidatus Berkiella aquae]|uniref:Endonuclease n=1 Tax=Candidatus Berkiella aquae TaxID=295108 RepID=A0A0Q9YKT0_9GAMM|nr:endonuclease [Candidatus Berkiella aquae]MCS5710870.1 endonuclease [Candidatus Berkiella aquae]